MGSGETTNMGTFEQWLEALPPWIRTLQLLTEQERWDYLRQQALSGQFDYQRQRQLAQADFQRLKFEQDARISGRVAIFESQVMAGCRKYLAPPSPLPQNEANELFSKRITDYDFIKKHSFGDPPALFKQQAFALEWAGPGWKFVVIQTGLINKKLCKRLGVL